MAAISYSTRVWSEILLSPVGVVDKAGNETRMINDYSYPDGASVNDFTDRSNFPPVSYNPPRDIARRIHDLRTAQPDADVLLMLGDVSGAFRHVPVHEDAVHMFAFAIDDYVVIDLACGFGWCGSPAFYSLAGSAINYIYEGSHSSDSSTHNASPFRGNVWCDDHTCVEIDEGRRCHDANVALREAMATVLGPTAINDRKFTPWRSKNVALGLMWDAADVTVSIPAEKLQRATTKVDQVLNAGRASKSDLQKLLGVFRHVASCFPSARAFYQRVHTATVAMLPYGARALDTDTIEDLRWLRAVMLNQDRFNGIPVSQFAATTPPSIIVEMDASNTGLCALDTNRREYIRLQYSDEECAELQSGSYQNSINVRELQSAVLAALLWGPHWQNASPTQPTHVQFHIDNMSAVSWASRRYSRHPTAQLYNRLISMVELKYGLFFTAIHIPSKLNTMADAGSRAWTESHPLWATWSDLSCAWTQVNVVPPFDNLSSVWERFCAATPWQDRQT
ncbi:hypothetical protein PHYSODRAFT_321009 [Phytophthora sojae]|uniref:RNase H type-1 domain-containing protein n=1 Tax=Phytophthora sojae (strain P6497) TaxID=1094619 RepID=G4YLW9_PHYSP|nr:hypothetical protein PHYSODRAFT_321009 [Phytophthora sojae]EGZ27164.1 hypothetical protein PHYSODRAFT_321009 [Phytophthora sojae]|eukprot:XP_009514439.1 hypothetical protein PHYSODRAFT_321009 [Phytophthora sojae]